MTEHAGEIPQDPLPLAIPPVVAGKEVTQYPEDIVPPIDENTEPGAVREFIHNLDRSDAIKFAIGVGVAAAVVGGWVTKRKLSVRNSRGHEIFISTDVPHMDGIVSIGERVMGGLAASLPKGVQAANQLHRNLAEEKADPKVGRARSTGHLLFAMLRRKKSGGEQKSLARPLQNEDDKGDYKDAVEEVAGWLGSALDVVERHRQGKNEPEDGK